MKALHPRTSWMLMLFALVACGGGGGGGGSSPPPGQGGTSNIAEFVFDCNLNGAVGVLTLQVEAVSSSGAVWGAGPNPDITAVVGAGSVIYYTAGTLNSTTAQYSIRGENQYADVTRLNGNERFVVEWLVNGTSLTIRVNPFGPGPASHDCLLRSSRRV